MFDWVLNWSKVLTNKPFYFSDFETLKVEKNSFTGNWDVNWLRSKKVTKILSWIYLISCRINHNLTLERTAPCTYIVL